MKRCGSTPVFPNGVIVLAVTHLLRSIHRLLRRRLYRGTVLTHETSTKPDPAL